MNKSASFQGFGPLIVALAIGVALPISAQNREKQFPRLTQPTVSVRPVMPAAPASDTLVPAVPATALAPEIEEALVPTSGVLVQTLDGRTLVSQNAEVGYNPASAVKLATALAALTTFGAQHRFDTAVWTNGSFDKVNGSIQGDLIISGRDPSFHYEHAVELARELNRLGIRSVTGDLIVPPKFTMNFDWSAQRSGDVLYDTLDSTRRPAAATRIWNDERAMLGENPLSESAPSVAVMGAVYVDSVPSGAQNLLVHRSSKLTDILKVLLCYSNNFMAERIGDAVGGPEGVRRVAISAAGLSPSDIRLATASGLGSNRLTPTAMLKIYRALMSTLSQSGLSPADILPVAGIDPGTLQKRYTEPALKGSVIAKTGTLTRTDGGASALVGQMRTATGETLLFTIFNRGRNVWLSRQNQDTLVSAIQNTRGGPGAFLYNSATLAMRLSDTQMHSAQANGEFEEATN